jgi:hypothetical protein
MPAPKSGHYAPRRAVEPGQRFGKLTAVRRAKRRIIEWKNGKPYSLGALWLCKCDCGREVFVCASYLNAGCRKKCGHGACAARGHGLFTGLRWWRHRRTYNSYSAMLERCTNPNATGYEDYGGRGIAVCERWSLPLPDGFNNFVADLGKRPPGKTLDRINPNKNYEPGNVRWATATVQANNKRVHWAGRVKEPPTLEEMKQAEQQWANPMADPVFAAADF